jgi:hypothetical protein
MHEYVIYCHSIRTSILCRNRNGRQIQRYPQDPGYNYNNSVQQELSDKYLAARICSFRCLTIRFRTGCMVDYAIMLY